MKSAYFESFTVDQVAVVIKWWQCELAASSGGVNCGMVIPKEVFVVHVKSVFEKGVVDLVLACEQVLPAWNESLQQSWG